jgi:hypothetical protein
MEAPFYPAVFGRRRIAVHPPDLADREYVASRPADD